MDNERAPMGSALNRKMSRKGFLKFALTALALLQAAGIPKRAEGSSKEVYNGRPKRSAKGDHDIVIAKGEDPYNLTMKAVASMGGMERFVGKGDIVVVKPNIGWDRSPEQAGNTNPHVIAALVAMSFNAGAKKVKVFDLTCNDPRRCYANSGIEKAAREKGAEIFFTDEWDTVKAKFRYDSPMNGWPVLRDALECDVFINVPVVKHHGLAGLTLSMKNLMGVCAGNRGLIHQDIGAKLVDLTDFVNPDLTIMDAYRVLVRNGPTGGDLKDVEYPKTVVAATDPTLADTYASILMKVDPLSIPNIRIAKERGFGSTDIENADKLFINV